VSDEPRWGLIYRTPSEPDVLLPQRYSRPEVAARVGIAIVKMFMESRPDTPNLEWRRSTQNVVSVASRQTGHVYMTIRPVLAQAWVDAGGAKASPILGAMAQALLDDDLE
jgi:hypothetical protein